MLTPLNWIGAQVQTDTEPYTNAQIIISRDEVTVSRPGVLLAQKSGAVDVEGTGATRTITFDDGTVWTATVTPAKSGCGCS